MRIVAGGGFLGWLFAAGCGFFDFHPAKSHRGNSKRTRSKYEQGNNAICSFANHLSDNTTILGISFISLTIESKMMPV